MLRGGFKRKTFSQPLRAAFLELFTMALAEAELGMVDLRSSRDLESFFWPTEVLF